MEKRLTERFDTVGGWQVYSRVSAPGRGGPPVVLVHGLAVSGRYMVPLARELSRAWDVYCPDLPGFGRSEKPRGKLTLVQLADWLREWMECLQLDGAVMVGNSMGAQIIVELAHLHPGAIRAAMLLGPTMDRSAPSVAEHLWRLVRDQFEEPASLAAIQAVDCLLFGPFRTVQMFREALAHDMAERIRGLRVPTMIVRGERDPIASQAWCEALARRLPDGELRVMAGAGHALNYNSPRRVAVLLRKLLRLPTGIAPLRSRFRNGVRRSELSSAQ